MNIIRYPKKEEWTGIIERPHMDVSSLNATVTAILDDVKQEVTRPLLNMRRDLTTLSLHH